MLYGLSRVSKQISTIDGQCRARTVFVHSKPNYRLRIVLASSSTSKGYTPLLSPIWFLFVGILVDRCHFGREVARSKRFELISECPTILSISTLDKTYAIVLTRTSNPGFFNSTANCSVREMVAALDAL